jgi:SAM-dependent methyltransferase
MLDSIYLKSKVKDHWEKETCGTRYGTETDRTRYFDEISAVRYELEPYILPFADFQSAKGKTVLEIGVGAGADFQNWCTYAQHASGVDLTERAIALTTERLGLNDIPPQSYSLRTADAENLPFDDDSFDTVYSWGVLMCTPDTPRAFREVFRVLKPGGTAKVMIYRLYSWTSVMLYFRYGLGRGDLKGKMRDIVAANLESPGTKVYTDSEGEGLLTQAGFTGVKSSIKLGPGDLLDVKRSERYNSAIYKLVWKVYPRWLVRLMGHKHGLYLMMTATKPAN